jgi:hypothetical protein
MLIDRSASMSAADAQDGAGARITRLEEAKRRALQTLGDLLDRPGPPTSITVAAFAASAVTLTPGSQGRGALADAIESIEPTDQPGDLSAAIDLARALASDAGAEETPEPLTVILYSDGGFSASDRPVGKGLVLRYERVGPDAAHHANAGIVAFSARRDYDDPGTLRVFARVRSAAAEPRSVTLRLTLNGRVVEDRTLPLPAPTPTPGGGGEEPGEATATFAVTGREGGVLLATILEPDALAADNVAGLVIPAAAPVRLLIVAPGASGREADPFLLSVLSAMDEARVRTVDAAGYEQLASGVEGAWAFDLVFFDRVRPERVPRSPSVSFGAAPPGGAVEMKPGDPRASSRPVSWRREHPLLRYVNLDNVVVQPPKTMTFADGPARVVDLANSATGPLIALVEEPGGARRVAVAFELARSNWPPNLSFPIFLQNTIDFLTLRAEAAGGRAFRTDQPVSVRAREGASRIDLFAGPWAGGAGGTTGAGDPGREQGAEGRAVLTAPVPSSTGAGGAGAGGSAGTPTVALGVVERAGLYSARGATDDTAIVAVNLVNATETALRVVKQIDLPGGVVAAAGGPAAPREVWAWFVLGALALLSVEWVIFARRMRAG